VSPRTGAARIPELDGLRGFAVLFVVVFHFYAHLPPLSQKLLYYGLLPVKLGWSGVDLFFVLSGFLIGGILLDHRESPRYYSAFYLRRIHRIFPIYYVMVALLFAGAILRPHSPMFVTQIPNWVFLLYGQNMVGDFTLAPGFLGVSWSLAVEEQFYLIFPAVVRYLNRATLWRVVLGCIISAPLIRVGLILHGWGFEGVHALLPGRADGLGLGVLAASLVRHPSARLWIERNQRWLHWLLSFLVVTVWLAMLKWNQTMLQEGVGYTLLGLVYFLLLLILVVCPGPTLRSAFSCKPLRWLGGISYCVYLIHEPLREAFERLLPAHDIFAMVFAAASTLIIASSSWRYFEGPLQRRAHERYRY
jgi:peptidoglycan/LPS O-acetylase OafA/YrhL